MQIIMRMLKSWQILVMAKVRIVAAPANICQAPTEMWNSTVSGDKHFC